jgi:hypothetical protein
VAVHACHLQDRETVLIGLVDQARLMV